MIVRKIESQRELRKQRVAAYARVSTEAEEQQDSFEIQVNYYTQYIKQNSEWEFVGVYADSGRSGTSVKHRPEFMRMIADANAKKMDLILVKSISRFARNVADAQRYVHELKENEVEVRFEREAISSFDPSSDLVFSILAAVAQEESRSISENVKWSYRKNAERGERRLGNNRVLGYDTNEDGQLVPNQDAWMVRTIFEDFAGGRKPSEISRHLVEMGAKRKKNDKPFLTSTIYLILKNEIFVGDRLLQKRAPKNYLTKRPDPTVAYTSYYIADDHEPIVDRKTWDCVQALLEQRKAELANGIHNRAGTHPLYSRLFCAACGAPYTHRIITSHDNVYNAWICTERYKGKRGNGCRNVMIREEVLFKEISDQLGWKWVNVDHFDFELFLKTVRRVEIGEAGVRVETIVSGP